jgi:hypothetical protein
MQAQMNTLGMKIAWSFNFPNSFENIQKYFLQQNAYTCAFDCKAIQVCYVDPSL